MAQPAIPDFRRLKTELSRLPLRMQIDEGCRGNVSVRIYELHIRSGWALVWRLQRAVAVGCLDVEASPLRHQLPGIFLIINSRRTGATRAIASPAIILPG